MFTFLSITGLVRTVLVIVGGIVVLRFFGRLANAKRNMEVERRMNEQNRKFEEDKRDQQKKVGETEVLKNEADKSSAQDIEYEVID